MGAWVSELIDKQIEKLDCTDELKHVLFLLREYAELQSGTWDSIMEEKREHRRLNIKLKKEEDKKDGRKSDVSGA